jgi:transposase
MKKLTLLPHMSSVQVMSKMHQQRTLIGVRGWQIIHAVQTTRNTVAQIAATLGITRDKVYSTLREYNEQGSAWVPQDKRGGRRESRCLMALSEEADLLHQLEAQALSGQILIFRHVKGVVEEKIGKSVSDDYVWDLFHRHKWSKKVPRQHHPLGDKRAQEEYKKKLPELLETKSLEFKDAQDTRPVKLFFQDEARFGRIDSVSSCWVPEGSRA